MRARGCAREDMIMTIEVYRTQVAAAMKRARATGKPVSFDNSGPAHAKAVLDVLVGAAERKIDIVAGVLHKDIWDASILRQFLARPGAEARVLLDEITDDHIPANSAVAALSDCRNLIVKRLPQSFHMHFCVSDSRDVRLEYDKPGCAASIAFGDLKGFGRIAEQTFEDLWSSVADEKPVTLAA